LKGYVGSREGTTEVGFPKAWLEEIHCEVIVQNLVNKLRTRWRIEENEKKNVQFIILGVFFKNTPVFLAGEFWWISGVF
jgi:hypothetical protein